MNEKFNKATEILDEDMMKVSGGDDDMPVVRYYMDEDGNLVPVDSSQTWEQIGDNVTQTYKVDEQDKKNA